MGRAFPPRGDSGGQRAGKAQQLLLMRLVAQLLQPLAPCSTDAIDPSPVLMGWVMTQVEVLDGGHHLCEAQGL